MIGWIQRLLGRVAGRDAAAADSSDPSECSSPASESEEERVSGSGEPILDEVYGQPGQSRALDRIEERANELADEQGIDLDDDRR